MKIDVTQADIDNGAYSCPIQAAVSRTLGVPVAVGYGDVEIDGKPMYRISKAAAHQAWLFDMGNEIAPFTLRLMARRRQS